MSPWRVAPLQSLSSDAITDSGASKSRRGLAVVEGGRGGPATCPDSFRRKQKQRFANGSEWSGLASVGVCWSLDFFCSSRFDVSVDVGFLRNVANAVFYFLTPPPPSTPPLAPVFPLSTSAPSSKYSFSQQRWFLWIIKKSSSLRWRDNTIKKMTCRGEKKIHRKSQ